MHGHCGTPWWRMRIMVLLLSGSKPFCAREVELQLVRREVAASKSYLQLRRREARREGLRSVVMVACSNGAAQPDSLKKSV